MTIYLSFIENLSLAIILAFGLVLFAPALCSSALAEDSHHADAKNPWTAETALQALKDGNERVVKGTPIHPNSDQTTKTRLAQEGQFPLAAILSCSDSRAPVERIFDLGFGDIFSIRVAGAVPGVDELGSIEYAVEHLGTPLAMVLHHTQCGAITAAVMGANESDNINSLLKHLDPVSKLVEKLPPEKRVAAAVATSSVYFRDRLTTLSPVLANAVKEGRLKLASGVYDISTGAVSFDD
ncbi:MAG: carbonic anhydrase [Deltaproteobacteria bacterium]|jgi:carbonic anhydrase|nr:carbonic anhydrase [Deltaproteobacteria bacterium]